MNLHCHWSTFNICLQWKTLGGVVLFEIPYWPGGWSPQQRSLSNPVSSARRVAIAGVRLRNSWPSISLVKSICDSRAYPSVRSSAARKLLLGWNRIRVFSLYQKILQVLKVRKVMASTVFIRGDLLNRERVNWAVPWCKANSLLLWIVQCNWFWVLVLGCLCACCGSCGSPIRFGCW